MKSVSRLAAVLLVLMAGSVAWAAGPASLTRDHVDLRLEAQSSPNMTGLVRAGWGYAGSVAVVYGGGNTPAFVAPGADNRIDLVTISATGVVAITQGVAAASPARPACPVDLIPLGYVYLKSTTTSIVARNDGDPTHGYIEADARPFVSAIPQDLRTTASPLFSNLTLSARTSGRVAFFTTGGAFSDSADLTWDGTYLSAANYKWPSGTQGSLLFMGASGVVSQDNASLYFDDATNQLELAAGTATAPVLTRKGYADDGLYWAADGELATALGGARQISVVPGRLRWDAASNTDWVIGSDTADGSDSGRLFLASGGAALSTRGAWIRLIGNEGTANYRGSLFFLAGSSGEAGTYSDMALFYTGGGYRWVMDREGDWRPYADDGSSLGDATYGVANLYLSDAHTTDPVTQGQVAYDADSNTLKYHDGGQALSVGGLIFADGLQRSETISGTGDVTWGAPAAYTIPNATFNVGNKAIRLHFWGAISLGNTGTGCDVDLYLVVGAVNFGPIQFSSSGGGGGPDVADWDIELEMITSSANNMNARVWLRRTPNSVIAFSTTALQAIETPELHHVNGVFAVGAGPLTVALRRNATKVNGNILLYQNGSLGHLRG